VIFSVFYLLVSQEVNFWAAVWPQEQS